MLDEEIIGLIFNKDERGIKELKNKYNDDILNMIKSILKDEDDINKSLELTYDKIQNILPSHLPRYLMVFVLRYARETSIDIYKEKNDKQLNEIDFDVETNFSMNNYQLIEEIINDLNAILNKMGQRDEIIFIRRYYLNEDVKTIAIILNENEKKVDERLKKITKIFLKFLKLNKFELIHYKTNDNKQININKLMCRIDDTLVERIVSIDSSDKYEELKKRKKNKNKKDIVKTLNDLVTDTVF